MSNVDWYSLGRVAATIDHGCICCILSFSKKLGEIFPDLDKNAYAAGLREVITDDYARDRIDAWVGEK